MKAKTYILIFLLIFTCCNIEKKPSSDEVKKILDKNFPASILETKSTPNYVPRVEIYIDGSMSCAGFVRDNTGSIGRTKYCNFLRTLRLLLATKTNVKFFKFGTMDTPVAIASSEDAKRLDFYNQMKTKLIELLESFGSRDNSKLPETLLVSTDAIPSTLTKKDIIHLIKPILILINKGYRFQLLGVRSEFNGYVYSEIKEDATVGWYSSRKYGERPFYCFIFSTDSNFSEGLIDRLPDEKFSTKLLDFSSGFIENIIHNFDIPFQLTNKEKNSLRMHSQENDVVYLWWRREEISHLGILKLILDLKFKTEVSDFNISGRGIRNNAYCSWLKTGEKVSPNHCRLISSEVISNNPKRMEFLFSFDEVKKPGWSAYKIIIFPGDGTFCAPKWVDEWSNQSDTSLKDFNKTLFLKDFVDGVMAGKMSRKKPLFCFYTAIRGR